MKFVNDKNELYKMVLEVGEGSTSNEVHSGLVLFKREYMAKQGEKCKNTREEKIEVGKAWRALSEEEKDRYNERAKKTKPEKGEKKKYDVPLYTRFSLPGFLSLAEGQGQAIEAKDAHEFLVVPDSGEEVKYDVSEDDPEYKRLKDTYWKVPFTQILKRILSGKESDNFEFLLMLYTVGAFLCPGSSTIEMGDFVKMTKKKKKGTCNVGGCILLSVSRWDCLLTGVQQAPLNIGPRIKERVEKKRGSSMGILHGSSGSKVYSARHEDSPILQSLNPVLKELRARFVKKLEESQRTLMKALYDELLKVQIGLKAKVKGMGNENATAKEGVETAGDASGNNAEEADDVDQVVEEIAREVATGSGDEELDEDETSKGDDEKDEDEDKEEHDLHDREVSDYYMVEEVEDEGDRDGRGGDDDDDEDEEEDDHEAEDDDKEVRDSDNEGEEDTHVLTMTPTNVPLLLDREWEGLWGALHDVTEKMGTWCDP
ncbi:nucleolar transcription factor 1-A-like [Neltuma alba]|uniref:nucleolar transcription factor 1-A-like n=1 Tax=Neltuma alba TaxID=207710 RepID=UPI0010A3774D|nr:nucleolar transcription factor 1-A-like [Prosopis alba]